MVLKATDATGLQTSEAPPSIAQLVKARLESYKMGGVNIVSCCDLVALSAVYWVDNLEHEQEALLTQCAPQELQACPTLTFPHSPRRPCPLPP